MNKTDTRYRPLRTSIDLSGSAVAAERVAPPADLADMVLEFWEYSVDPAYELVPVQVFPSGCVLLRFNIRPEGVEPIFYGPSLNNDMKGLFYRDWVIFGAAFYPNSAYPLLGLSLHEVRDLRIRMDHLWSPAVISSVCAEMWETRSLAERVEVLSRFLRRVIRTDLRPNSDFLNVFEDIVRLASQPEDIGTIARRHHTTGRTLRRQFSKYMGIGPKQLIRLVRVQRSMNALHQRPQFPLATLAANSGFSDQAHFSREFKRVAGFSPSEFTSLVGRIHDMSLPAWERLDPRWIENAAPEIVDF